ncbi:MAG TPA: hypothetical protein VJ625_17190 [Propionibacteriaceae bacterium]|nr:hypothetical protein [Propionibacteriaceae bacterium]
MSGREGLGRLFDIGIAFAPVDLDTANGATGKRINMAMHRTVTFVCALAVGAADDLTFDVKQHTAYTGGTSNDLDTSGVAGSTGIDHFYIKSEAALDNDEAWTRVDQTAASEVTLTGATYGDKQNIVAIEIHASMLAAGYTHMSVDVATTTAAAHLGVGLYLPHGLRFGRAPARLGNLLRPSAVNA